MKHSTKTIALLVVWTASLLCGTFLCLNYLHPEYVASAPEPWQTRTFSNLKYQAKPGQEVPPKIVIETPSRQIYEMDLEIKFQASAVEEISAVFQTAPRDEGLRFELARMADESIVGSFLFGHIYGAPAKVLTVIPEVKLNQWYKLRVRLNYWDRLSVFLEDEWVGDLEGGRAHLQEFVLGNGVNGLRYFHGAIELTHLKISVVDKVNECNLLEHEKRVLVEKQPHTKYRAMNYYFNKGNNASYWFLISIIVVNLISTIGLLHHIRIFSHV